MRSKNAKNVMRRAIAILCAVFVAACASRPEIRAESDPSANLAGYQTFGFFDKVATDNSSYGTLLTSRLKEATKRELEKHGYRYDATDPQLLVNFNVNIKDKTRIESTPAAGGYYGYRAGMYGTWAGYPQDVHTVNYQDGTLAIDVVDAAKRQVVWQGVAQGRVSESAVKDPGPAIDKVVAEIFAKYPTPQPVSPAASAAPQSAS